MVAGGRELIDTLWNVNIDVVSEYFEKPERINRYIMECKLNVLNDRRTTINLN